MKLPFLAALAAVVPLLVHAQEEIKGAAPASSAPAPADVGNASEASSSGAPRSPWTAATFQRFPSKTNSS